MAFYLLFLKAEVSTLVLKVVSSNGMPVQILGSQKIKRLNMKKL